MRMQSFSLQHFGQVLGPLGLGDVSQQSSYRQVPWFGHEIRIKKGLC